MGTQQERRASADEGAKGGALAAYLAHRYPRAKLDGVAWPLPDEPFTAIWRRWADEAARVGAAAVLRRHLPQLAFPVAEGVSALDEYRAATRRGADPADLPAATGLELPRPEAVELALHPSVAGHVPVITVRDRATFVRLLQALIGRNEPIPIRDSQGAAMIGGYVNWRRIDALRAAWEARPSEARTPPTWPEAFAAIRAEKALYQDRLIVLSDGPYAAVPAAEVGLGEGRWREASAVLRRDHECAHYLTSRLFGGMRNHLLDELVADYAGMVGAFGGFDADRFLRFLGLGRGAPVVGARAAIYRGDPPLGDDDFASVCALVARAARRLASFDGARPLPAADPIAAARRLSRLAVAGLEALAEPEVYRALARAEEAEARDTVPPAEHARPVSEIPA